MSFRDRTPQFPLRDILDAICMIEEFTAGMDLEAFRSNPMAVAAVERKLLIIAEAGIRLGERASELCPDQPLAEYPGHGELAPASI